MILTNARHGRTRRATAALINHLLSTGGQRSRVVWIDWSPAADIRRALKGMEELRDVSRAEVAFHHITINPRTRLTASQRDDVVHRICLALDAMEHARVLSEHSGKARIGNGADHHFHLVLGHVGPSFRALNMRQSHVRLEAVARSVEYDLGEALTPSRRSQSVAARLRAMGRADVAEAVEAAVPAELPRSTTSSRARARSERQGSMKPQEAREAVEAAWASSDSAAALRAALSASGLAVEPGRKAGVWLVTHDSAIVGALDRLARLPRDAVDARMSPSSRAERQSSALPSGRSASEQDRREPAEAQRPRRASGTREPGPHPGRGHALASGSLPANIRECVTDERRYADARPSDDRSDDPRRGFAELLSRLDAREGEHFAILERLDAALAAPNRHTTRLRSQTVQARKAVLNASLARRQTRADLAALGPRPEGISAYLRGETHRWQKRLVDVKIQVEHARAAAIEACKAWTNQRRLLAKAVGCDDRRVAQIRLSQELAREAATNGLAWVADAREVFALAPDEVALWGIDRAVEFMRDARTPSQQDVDLQPVEGISGSRTDEPSPADSQVTAMCPP